jgi:hypothetical protein
VVTIEEPFAFVGHHSPKAKFAVTEWKVTQVLAAAEPTLFLLVVGQCVLVPEDANA